MRKYCYLLLIFITTFQFCIADEKISRKDRMVWGPLITESWEDGHLYNLLCPDDPVHGGKCFVGNFPLSVAHIINYHKNIENVYFDDEDDYFSDPIYIDDDHALYNFPSFPELNSYLDTIRYCYANTIPLSNLQISALNFACDVATQHQYVPFYKHISSSGDVFINKFNYQNAEYTTTIDDNFYVALYNNIIHAYPAILGISGQYGGTIVLCDGYESPADLYHLNFMGGGGYNGWYSLPDGMPSGYTSIDCAIINIEPPALSVHEDPENNILFNNFPNPFHSSTTFSFKSKEPIQNAEIKIYNIKGQLVRELRFDASLLSRFNELTWDGKNKHGQKVAPGLYLYQLLINGEQKAERKCLLIE